MADEIWVDPEKLWALAAKINAEPSNLIAAASGIGGVLNYLPDAVRSRVISYIPTNSDLQLCVDAMSDLAAYLQQKALAFAYLDGYDYFGMEGGGPSPTDAMLIDGSMFAGSMFAGSMFAGSMFDGSMFAGAMDISDPRLGLFNFLGSTSIDITEGLGQRAIAGDWLNISKGFEAKWATLTPGEKWKFARKYTTEYDKFGKGLGEVATGVGFAIDFAYMATEDWNDYDGGELATALVLDAAESAALAAAGYYGGVAGAAIGTMICPGVGTVIGGVVGSVFAGYVAGEVADWFDESGYEDIAVSGITYGVGEAADAVSGAVSSAGDAISDFCDSLW